MISMIHHFKTHHGQWQPQPTRNMQQNKQNYKYKQINDNKNHIVNNNT